MKKVVLVLAVLLALSVGATAEPTGYQARIGAWNLGADAIRRSDGTLLRRIPDRRVQKLAQVIAMLSPDVLAISEIAPDSVVEKLLGHLESAGRCYEATMLDQSSNLNVGFLHSCHVTAANARFVSGSNLGNDNLRRALAVDFRVGEFDFTAIVVHLKSGRRPTNRRTRNAQVEAIAAFVSTDVFPDEKDILILGDYNMIPGRDISNFEILNPRNELRFITSEELEPRPGFSKVFSHISRSGGPGNLLDGFAIAREHTIEYHADSVRIVSMDQFLEVTLSDFRRRYSDHLPMMALFRVDEDDD